MSEDKTKNPQKPQDVSRRDIVRTGVKAAYVVPLVLGAVAMAELSAQGGVPMS